MENGSLRRGAQLATAQLLLNFLDEFDRGSVVGEAYLAHLKAKGAPPEVLLR